MTAWHQSEVQQYAVTWRTQRLPCEDAVQGLTGVVLRRLLGCTLVFGAAVAYAKAGIAHSSPAFANDTQRQSVMFATRMGCHRKPQLPHSVLTEPASLTRLYAYVSRKAVVGLCPERAQQTS